MEPWKVILRAGAQGQLEEAFKNHPDLEELILQRLGALKDFPPEKWFDIHHQLKGDAFSSDGQLVKISGEADRKTRIVWVDKINVGRKKP